MRDLWAIFCGVAIFAYIAITTIALGQAISPQVVGGVDNLGVRNTLNVSDAGAAAVNTGSPGPEVQSTSLCNSQYAVYLGVATSRKSIAVQPQYDTTAIWVGGPKVTTCFGCPFSISDAGFTDGGPGVVGEEITTSGYLAKDLGTDGTAAKGLFCIKQSGAQDGTLDGGWTVTTELP
jgi:hypothetical protein